MTLSISRRTFWLGVATLAVVAGGLVWRHFQPLDYANFPPTAAGPWIAFGDSLTEGFGASEGRNYPAVLSRRLGLPILNLGRSGDTTADGLSRLADVTRHQPRVVLLCLGGNDSLQHVAPARMIANLASIIDRLQQDGAFVALIGVRSASLRDKNEKHFRRLAREKRTLYVPNILRGLVMNPTYMSDALHPNDAGYEKIAARLEGELRPLLPTLNAGN